MAVNNLLSRAEAGDFIPVAESNQIIQGMIGSSAVLQLAQRVPMSTKQEKTKVLSALPDAYWVDGDTGLKQTTKMDWDNKTITAEELAVIVPVPEAVLADSAIDLFAQIRPRLVEAFGKKLDEACLFGVDAPASFTDAIVPDAIAAGNSIGRGDLGDLGQDVGDAGGLLALIEEDGYVATGYAARTSIRAALRGMRNANGDPAFIQSLQAGTPDQFYANPITYPVSNGTFNAQGVDLIAGDWSKAVVGVRQDITFKLFTEGVISDGSGNVVLNLMQQDSVALRVVARYGFAVSTPISAQNIDATTPYPFSVLESESAS